MKQQLQNAKITLASMLMLGTLFTSCSNDDSIEDTPPPIVDNSKPKDKEPVESSREFTVAFSSSSTGETKVYTQTLPTLETGNVSFEKFGFEMPSTRTARIFTSNDGKNLFNLDYGGGRVYKYSVDGGQGFTKKSEKNVEFAMGTAYPRWTKASEEYASIHYADGRNAVRVFDAAGKYVRTDVKLRVMSINLNNLEFGNVEQFNIPMSGNDTEYDYVSRVDAPIISGNKAYYGMGKSGYDPEDPKARKSATYKNVETLVVDYPSLTNPKIISTNVGGAKGATNGYRTSVSYKDEKGDVYQITSVPDNTYDTHILKISNGNYDESFDLNLSELVGENTRSNGWFYAGNGIGYVPYARSDEGGLSDEVWSVARVDLYNGTAVKLNLPTNLWLQQYQNVVVDGYKVYMAVTPKGTDGNIYIFDTKSTSPDGFTKGATLKNAADAVYIGVY